MTIQQSTNKRRIYCIDRDFQGKFIFKFCLLIVLAGVIITGILYLFGKSSTTVSVVNSRVVVRSTADFLFPILVQTILVVMVIVGLAALILALLFSHKIAGPLYRFRIVLGKMKSGNLSCNFNIRNYDQLQELSEEFNSMINEIRERVNLIKANVANLKAKKGDISEKETEELDRNLNYFKT